MNVGIVSLFCSHFLLWPVAHEEVHPDARTALKGPRPSLSHTHITVSSSTRPRTDIQVGFTTHMAAVNHTVWVMGGRLLLQNTDFLHRTFLVVQW